MPLPKQRTNWAARLVVVLLFCAMAGLLLPLTWLLGTLHAPDFVAYPVLAIWVVLALYGLLWTISVWAPVRGKKLVSDFLKTPWLPWVG